MESVQSATIQMSIYLSSYTVDNSHYNKVRDKFMENLKKDHPRAVENYRGCKTDEERITMFHKYFEWEPIPLNFLERLQKNSELSSHFRDDGNSDFKKEQFSAALRSYNLALCFAPPSSQEEVLAYSNRSALFTQICEYELALKDILHAKESPSSPSIDESITKKLDARQIKCEESLRKNWNDVLTQKAKCEQGANYCREKLNQVKKSNNLLLGAEQSVKMEVDEVTGRRLVATEDIPAGTVVLRDKPYALVLDGLLTWDMEHCATCTRPILGGIPDPQSSFSMYCDETCRSTSKTLPNPLLTYLHLCSPLHDCLLPLTVLLHSPTLKVNESSPDTPVPGLNSVYDPTTYDSAYRLVQHRQRYEFDSTPPTEFKALFLARLVRDLISVELPPPLLVRHLENLPYNQITLCTWQTEFGCFSIPYFANLAKQRQSSVLNVAYASGVFSLVALLNSSCDPNAVFLKNCRTDSAFLLSSRRIKKGEEVSVSYKGHWSKVGYNERQEYLRKEYHFDCQCAACEARLGDEDVEDGVGEVGEELEEVLVDIEMQLEQGVGLVKEERYTEAFDTLVECCDRLSHFDRRYQLGVVAQDLLRRIVVQLSML